MTSQLEAIDQLRRAVKNEGPMPEYHRRMMAKHRSEWPTLWAAIDAVLRADTLRFLPDKETR